MKKYLPIVLAALWVAVFSTYAFSPTNYHYLVWISIWGLFYLERKFRGNYKALLWLGVFVAVVVYSLSFDWIIYMATVFGGFPLPIALIIFIVSGIALNLWFPFFFLGFSFLAKHVRKGFPWIAGFISLLGEFLTPQVFPWYWGNVVAGSELLSQTAEYFSIYGLSFLLFVVSYALYSLFGKFIVLLVFEWKITKSLRKRLFSLKFLIQFFKNQKVLKFITPVLLLYVFFLTLGSYLYHYWENIQPSGYVDTVMVQPNAPLEFRDGRSVAETMKDLMLRIERLTKEAVESHPDPVDLIVLPESGVPFFSAHKHNATIYPPIYWEQFDSLMYILANQYKANVFFNELDASYIGKVPSKENLRYYNSSALYDPNGVRKNSYQKVFLLIFGEYMPFEFLYLLSPQTGRFEPGTNLNLIPIYKPNSKIVYNENFQHPNFMDTYIKRKQELEKIYEPFQIELKEWTSFLPLICYEVIIPEFVRKFKDSGNPGFIVNVTNDKWYGISKETFQHGDLARIRSIEWRRWMVRSTNSGSSFFVDHLGRVVDRKFTGQETSEYLRKKIAIIQSEPTFYVRYGNLLIYLGMIYFAGLFLFFYAKNNKIAIRN